MGGGMKNRYSAKEIAAHVGLSKKRIKQVLAPDVIEGGMYYYSPDRLPVDWRETIELRESLQPTAEANTVTFSQVKNPKTKLQAAVMHAGFSRVQDLMQAGGDFNSLMEDALRSAHIEIRRKFAGWSKHTRSWHRWYDRWFSGGMTLGAVTLQKQGKCGRKPLSDKLDPEQIREARAACVEYGGKVAPAARLMFSDPELSADFKESLQYPSSKSWVPRSVRKAIEVPKLMVSHHHGAKQSRVAGSYTMRDYSQVAAGEIWQSDDLTPPVYFWIESPRDRHGFLIMQGQWLPMIDLGSQKILSHSLIARESRQYSSDDIWALIGKTIFAWGLPSYGFHFEKGHWAASRVLGKRTGIDGWEREGGLTALGCKVMQATTPNGKVIEGMFEHLQRQMQRLPGYRGRNATIEKFDRLEADVRKCRNGQCHPRDIGLLHISQMSIEFDQISYAWNNARNDGKVCQGRTPEETWMEKLPALGLRSIPGHSAYMLYATMARVKISRNGLRVQHSKETFYWDNPEKLGPLQGKECLVWYTPEYAEKVTVTDLQRQFICHADALRELHPFNATEGELRAESQRKAARLAPIRTEYRNLKTLMPSNRGHAVPCDEATARLNSNIEEAGRQTIARRQERTSKIENRAKHARDLAKILSSDPSEDEKNDGVSARTETPRFEHNAVTLSGENTSCPSPAQQNPQ